MSIPCPKSHTCLLSLQVPSVNRQFLKLIYSSCATTEETI